MREYLDLIKGSMIIPFKNGIIMFFVIYILSFLTFNIDKIIYLITAKWLDIFSNNILSIQISTQILSFVLMIILGAFILYNVYQIIFNKYDKLDIKSIVKEYSGKYLLLMVGEMVVVSILLLIPILLYLYVQQNVVDIVSLTIYTYLLIFLIGLILYPLMYFVGRAVVSDNPFLVLLSMLKIKNYIYVYRSKIYFKEMVKFISVVFIIFIVLLIIFTLFTLITGLISDNSIILGMIISIILSYFIVPYFKYCMYIARYSISYHIYRKTEKDIDI